jgi:hypothetical protein
MVGVKSGGVLLYFLNVHQTCYKQNIQLMRIFQGNKFSVDILL